LKEYKESIDPEYNEKVVLGPVGGGLIQNEHMAQIAENPQET